MTERKRTFVPDRAAIETSLLYVRAAIEVVNGKVREADDHPRDKAANPAGYFAFQGAVSALAGLAIEEEAIKDMLTRMREPVPAAVLGDCAVLSEVELLIA